MSIAKSLKKALILKYFESKKTKEPFDAEAAEGFELPADADININNSHFFTASNESGETLSIRLGMRNDSDFEIFVLWRSRDGRFLVHEKDSYSPAECPVKFIKLETEKRWRTEFNGRLREMATGEVRESSISVEFEARLPIYDFVYHADRFTGMAESIAREKWNKDFFAELSRNNQRHYEQTGHMKGEVHFGDESFVVDLPCVRDHSFGRREWDLMNDHIWFCCQNDEGEALSYSIVNYPRMKRIYSGYTNMGSPVNLTLRSQEITAYDPSEGLGGDKLVLDCVFADGKKRHIELVRTDNVKCVFGGGKYVFQEGLAEFTIDGKRARGTIEYGFNTDPKRWEGYSLLPF